MLGYRNGPAGPRLLRPWMTCLAWSWPLLAGGFGYSVTTRTAGTTGPLGPCGGYLSAASRIRSATGPGQLRARLTRPKSSIYHFAAEVLLALI